MDNSEPESKIEFASPVLEDPPLPESPVTGTVALFADESIAITTAKFSMTEALLNLLTRDLKFDDFIREVLLTVMRVVKSEAGSILEVDHSNQTIFFRSIVGTSSDRLGKFVIPMGKGIVGHVAEARQPVVVDNVAENQIHLKSIQDAVGFNARNLVALPISIRGRIYGILELLNRVGEENYTNADVELLTYLCEVIAKAIEIRMMLTWSAKRKASNVTPDSNSGEAA